MTFGPTDYGAYDVTAPYRCEASADFQDYDSIPADYVGDFGEIGFRTNGDKLNNFLIDSDKNAKKSYNLLKIKSKRNEGFMTEEEKAFWEEYRESIPLYKKKANYFKLSKEGMWKHFEKLDEVDRLYLAGDYKEVVEGLLDPSEREEEISAERASLVADRCESLSLNPFFRKAISIKSRDASDGSSEYMRSFYKKLDEELNKRNFLNSLRPLSPWKISAFKTYFSSGEHKRRLDKLSKSSRTLFPFEIMRRRSGTFERFYEEYRMESITVAQILFLAQLGDVRYVLDDGRVEKWNKSLSSLFCHGGRVTFIFPLSKGKEVYRGIKKILGFDAETCPVYSREAATHIIKKKSRRGFGMKELVEAGGFLAAIEAATSGSYSHYGMDSAIGGLMNVGADGAPIINDGTNGHFYIGVRKYEPDVPCAMLIGLETEAPGLANKYGHVHDARALSSEISSTGGFKVDCVGRKLGGRVVDLSALEPEYLCGATKKFRKTYRRLWSRDKSYLEDGAINGLINALGGRKLERDELERIVFES